MSVHAISWAYKVAEVTDPYEAFLLVTLADQADDWGVLWAKQSTLMEKCRCSKRKVQYALQALEERGLVLQFRRRRDNGSQRSSAFILVGWEGRKRPASVDEHPVLEQLHLAGLLDPDTIGVHLVHPGAGCTPCASRAHDVHPQGARGAPLEPSLEPSREPFPPTPQRPEARADGKTGIRPSRPAYRKESATGLWERAFDAALAGLDTGASPRTDAAPESGIAGVAGGDRGGAVHLPHSRDGA
ncbi:helix-turn-helix domain-containing protein [Amaricoccus sp.]|uniref:helix-turn-helix domain-containing protein n=1 Tax=Amaricoccus sp. TaxID=1872485 RepID=UPI003FA52F77